MTFLVSRATLIWCRTWASAPRLGANVAAGPAGAFRCRDRTGGFSSGAPGAGGSAGRVGRVDGATAERAAGVRPGSRLLTWWGPSESPGICGAVARPLAQEAAVHTYDAQLTVGTLPCRLPLPARSPPPLDDGADTALLPARETAGELLLSLVRPYARGNTGGPRGMPPTNDCSSVVVAFGRADRDLSSCPAQGRVRWLCRAPMSFAAPAGQLRHTET